MLLAIASLSLVALAGSGCGDDDDTEVTLPTISVEDEAQTTATDQLPTTTKPTETQPPNGGTGTINPNREDSPKNDKPPDPGSPEEAFENACKQNPAACG